jgi:hypothetical protein
MNDRNKRLIALIIMLGTACLYVDSHVQHDIWMTQRLVDQQDQIDFLLKYVIILKREINEKPNR